MTGSVFPWSVTVEEEYKKDPKLKCEDVRALQSWIESQKHLPMLDEEMLAHMLHACYYNIEHAKSATETLYSYKNTMPDFFCNWDMKNEDIQEIINDVLVVAPLPQCDSEGNKVMVCKLNNSDPAKYIYPLCVKWLLMSSFHALWSMGIQKGFVLVYDASGFSMSHLLRSPLGMVKNYISFGENASPIRVLKVVFINTSPVVKKLISLVKPFLNKELINMISFHTSPESFFKEMPKENIPADYGGTAPPMLSLHRDYLKQVTLNREWIMKEETIKIDETKRVKKSKGSPTKVEKSFKKLEID